MPLVATSDHYVRCKGCGMSFWVGDGQFDRDKAARVHTHYALDHHFEPTWELKGGGWTGSVPWSPQD